MSPTLLSKHSKMAKSMKKLKEGRENSSFSYFKHSKKEKQTREMIWILSLACLHLCKIYVKKRFPIDSVHFLSLFFPLFFIDTKLCANFPVQKFIGDSFTTFNSNRCKPAFKEDQPKVPIWSSLKPPDSQIHDNCLFGHEWWVYNWCDIINWMNK